MLRAFLREIKGKPLKLKLRMTFGTIRHRIKNYNYYLSEYKSYFSKRKSYKHMTDNQILAEAKKEGFVIGNGFYAINYVGFRSDLTRRSTRLLMKKATQAIIKQGNPAEPGIPPQQVT